MMTNKTILSDTGPKPFTAQVVEDKIMLQLHQSILRMGERSAIWLRDALANSLDKWTPKQTLEHEGKVILTVLGESQRWYIIATNVRFVMVRDTVAKLVEWLKSATNNKPA